jgi:hypothetical protein
MEHSSTAVTAERPDWYTEIDNRPLGVKDSTSRELYRGVERDDGANQDGDVGAEKDDLCIDWAGHVSLSG